MVYVLKTMILGMTFATGIYTVLVVLWVLWALYRWKEAMLEIERRFWVSEKDVRIRMLERACATEQNLNAARDALSAVYPLVLVTLILSLVYYLFWVFVG